jgi:hypothetical protein
MNEAYLLLMKNPHRLTADDLITIKQASLDHNIFYELVSELVQKVEQVGLDKEAGVDLTGPEVITHKLLNFIDIYSPMFPEAVDAVKVGMEKSAGFTAFLKNIGKTLNRGAEHMRHIELGTVNKVLHPIAHAQYLDGTGLAGLKKMKVLGKDVETGKFKEYLKARQEVGRVNKNLKKNIKGIDKKVQQLDEQVPYVKHMAPDKYNELLKQKQELLKTKQRAVDTRHEVAQAKKQGKTLQEFQYERQQKAVNKAPGNTAGNNTKNTGRTNGNTGSSQRVNQNGQTLGANLKQNLKNTVFTPENKKKLLQSAATLGAGAATGSILDDAVEGDKKKKNDKNKITFTVGS